MILRWRSAVGGGADGGRVARGRGRAAWPPLALERRARRWRKGILDAALARVPPEVPVLALPTQSVGLSLEHQDYAAPWAYRLRRLLAVWTELGACVARAGVKKLLIFNAHGGNVSSMDIVARQLRMQCGLLVYHSSWFNLPSLRG